MTLTQRPVGGGCVGGVWNRDAGILTGSLCFAAFPRGGVYSEPLHAEHHGSVSMEKNPSNGGAQILRNRSKLDVKSLRAGRAGAAASAAVLLAWQPRPVALCLSGASKIKAGKETRGIFIVIKPVGRASQTRKATAVSLVRRNVATRRYCNDKGGVCVRAPSRVRFLQRCSRQTAQVDR